MFLKNLTLAVVLIWVAAGAVCAQKSTRTAALKTPDTTANGATAQAKKPEVKPGEYKVGEADVLRVNVWKEPEVSQTVVVRTDGSISLPLINEVRVSGLTPVQAQDMIADKLKAYLTNPQVTVTVTEIHSKRAFITGEVARPGGYSLNVETSVLQLIAQAGGLTPFAKKGDIVVLRYENGQQRRLKFEYNEVIKGKRSEQNVALHPGDTVVVP
ncbi:MAG TPA: polysaccharide biosynthesis/export family protein [Candidatus Limnocylindrales bacterium]|nr:polysaccharide biosynthesis/export family protein [Candidatus Limnocylindrales bacterium]